MICPNCKSELTRRSQRRGVRDQFLSLFGLRPWRCRTCDVRFYAWTVPAGYVFYVHCAHCGSLDLERVSRERVASGLRLLLASVFRIPAYRCDECRSRFFSIRLFKRIVPTRVEAPRAEEAPQAEEAVDVKTHAS